MAKDTQIELLYEVLLGISKHPWKKMHRKMLGSRQRRLVGFPLTRFKQSTPRDMQIRSSDDGARSSLRSISFTYEAFCLRRFSR